MKRIEYASFVVSEINALADIYSDDFDGFASEVCIFVLNVAAARGLGRNMIHAIARNFGLGDYWDMHVVG